MTTAIRQLRIVVLLAVLFQVLSPAPAYSADAAADTKTAAEARHNGGPGQKDMPVKSNPADWRNDLAIYSLVVFLLLMAILTKFAWKPISDALDKREASVADNIAKAQRAADEAKVMIAQYQAQLAGAADQVRGMLEEARRDAETTKASIIDEANKSAQALQDRATRDIKAATDGALQQLAEKSADLAVDLAGKMLQAKLTKADHQQLVAEGVKKFLAEPSRN
jgi:F-type H+-transporting ATPase subunit b